MPRPRSRWKEAVAGAALLVGGVTGDVAARTARPERTQEAAPTSARREAGRQRVAERPEAENPDELSLDQLQAMPRLDRQQSERLGHLQTEGLISSGGIRRYYGHPAEAKAAFERDFLQHHQSEVLEEALTARADTLSQAAINARIHGQNEDCISLSELVHPWNGIEAALSFNRMDTALEIFRRTNNFQLLIMKGAGENVAATRAVRSLVDHFSRREVHAFEHEVRGEIALMRFQRDRMRDRMTNSGDSQAEIDAEMHTREQEIERVHALLARH